MRRQLMYVELKTGYADDGPAWIGWVRYSKSGRSVYYGGRMLQRLSGGGVVVATTSTPRPARSSGSQESRRTDAIEIPAGSGPVRVDDDAAEEYARIVGPRRGRRESPRVPLRRVSVRHPTTPASGPPGG